MSDQKVRKGLSKFWKAVLLFNVFGILILVGSCSYILLTAEKKAPPSRPEWVNHKKEIENRISLMRKMRGYPAETYKMASLQASEPYVRDCSLAGCYQYRRYLEKVMQGAADGFISPKENEEIQSFEKLLWNSIDAAESTIPK